MVDIALYEPEIPQNAATIIRTCACLGLAMHIVGPAAFHWSDRGFRRAGLDYLDVANVTRHAGFEAFRAALGPRRLVLLTTKGAVSYTAFAFRPSDVLLFGRESAGVPEPVHAAADYRLVIPMQTGRRSLNVAVAAAMVTGEAVRQTCSPLPETSGFGQ